MARDPARIDRVLRDLGSFWKAHPDLRLGQLLLNAVDPDDLYQVEDLPLVRRVMKFYSDADLERGRPPLISKDDEEAEDEDEDEAEDEEKNLVPPGKDLVSQEVTERKIAQGATVGPGGPAETHVMREGGVMGASGATGPQGRVATASQRPRPIPSTMSADFFRGTTSSRDSEDE